MQLRLFRSLVTKSRKIRTTTATTTALRPPASKLFRKQRQDDNYHNPKQRQCCEGLIAALASEPDRRYDGAVVSLGQLENAPSVRDVCAEHSFRLICLLEPENAGDAGDLLDRLGRCLGGSSGNIDLGGDPTATAPLLPFVELVVMRAPIDSLTTTTTTTAEEDSSSSQRVVMMGETLDYLGEVLPLAANFLERNPSVGSSHGKVNSQGKPLADHVIGVCHEFPAPHFGIRHLSEMMDVFSPARLALSASNLVSSDGGDEQNNDGGGVLTPGDSFGLNSELEALAQGTDLLYASPPPSLAGGGAAERFGPGTLFGEVWCAQRLEGARETCVAVEGDDEAPRLRAVFGGSAAWREGAGARRAEELKAAAEASRGRNARGPVLSDPAVWDAASSFGMTDDLLPPSDDGGCDGKGALPPLTKEAVKKRWRELALKNHPDTSASLGDDSTNNNSRGEYFATLRKHFRTLLQVASRMDEERERERQEKRE